MKVTAFAILAMFVFSIAFSCKFLNRKFLKHLANWYIEIESHLNLFWAKFWFNFLVSIVLIFKSLKSILIFQRSGLGMKGFPCILVRRPISKEVYILSQRYDMILVKSQPLLWPSPKLQRNRNNFCSDYKFQRSTSTSIFRFLKKCLSP